MYITKQKYTKRTASEYSVTGTSKNTTKRYHRQRRLQLLWNLLLRYRTCINNIYGKLIITFFVFPCLIQYDYLSEWLCFVFRCAEVVCFSIKNWLKNLIHIKFTMTWHEGVFWKSYEIKVTISRRDKGFSANRKWFVCSLHFYTDYADYLQQSSKSRTYFTHDWMYTHWQPTHNKINKWIQEVAKRNATRWLMLWIRIWQDKVRTITRAALADNLGIESSRC